LPLLLLYDVGLLQYCNFGPWTSKEDQQLKKNWKKVVEVRVYSCYFWYCYKDLL